MGSGMVEPAVPMLLDLGMTREPLTAPVQGDDQVELHPDVEDAIHLGEIGQPLGVDRPGQQEEIFELHSLLGGEICDRAPVAVGEEVGLDQPLITDPLLEGEGRGPAPCVGVRPRPFVALVVHPEGRLLGVEGDVEITREAGTTSARWPRCRR